MLWWGFEGQHFVEAGMHVNITGMMGPRLMSRVDSVREVNDEKDRNADIVRQER